MSTNYWAIIAGEKIQPFLLVISCYQCSNWLKLTPYHEIPLAISLLKCILCVLSHNNTGLWLFNDMSTNYWTTIAGEKIQPFLLVTSCYQCSNWLKLTPYHEISLAMSAESYFMSHNNTGLLLFHARPRNIFGNMSAERYFMYLIT
jgi:hypothetical protein